MRPRPSAARDGCMTRRTENRPARPAPPPGAPCGQRAQPGLAFLRDFAKAAGRKPPPRTVRRCGKFGHDLEAVASPHRDALGEAVQRGGILGPGEREVLESTSGRKPARPKPRSVGQRRHYGRTRRAPARPPREPRPGRGSGAGRKTIRSSARQAGRWGSSPRPPPRRPKRGAVQQRDLLRQPLRPPRSRIIARDHRPETAEQ